MYQTVTEQKLIKCMQNFRVTGRYWKVRTYRGSGTLSGAGLSHCCVYCWKGAIWTGHIMSYIIGLDGGGIYNWAGVLHSLRDISHSDFATPLTHNIPSCYCRDGAADYGYITNQPHQARERMISRSLALTWTTSLKLANNHRRRQLPLSFSRSNIDIDNFLVFLFKRVRFRFHDALLFQDIFYRIRN